MNPTDKWGVLRSLLRSHVFRSIGHASLSFVGSAELLAADIDLSIKDPKSACIVNGVAAAEPKPLTSLEKLKTLFQQTFRTGFDDRQCNENIRSFLKLARDNGIEMSDADVFAFSAPGFFGTVGFYSYKNKNQWKGLYDFHVVLVKDGHVFDFHLHDPLVLSLPDYVRLQFTPPYESFPLLPSNKLYISLDELPSWNVNRYDPIQFRDTTSAQPTWGKNLGDVVDLQEMMTRPRFGSP